MRTFVAALAGAAILAAAPVAARPTPEQTLATALAGRTAGEPVACISLNTVRSSQVIDGTAIVYDIGGVRYVNRPTAGSETLDDWKILVTNTPGTRLCRSDTVQLIDRGSHVPTGFVLLGDFVPYRKAAARPR